MQKEKIALIALVIIVVAALCTFLVAVNTDVFENLFKEKQTIAEGDCADIHYIGRYASNYTIFDTSYAFAANKSGGNPLKVFVSFNTSETSWKSGYSSGLIKGFMQGIIGLQEGETKTIGPIPPEDAYGAQKLTEGAIFNTLYAAYGTNITVEVTNYTSENLSFKWIDVDALSNFTIPRFVINDLNSDDTNEYATYLPPYYLWENSSQIVNITEDNVIVSMTPTKSTNIITLGEQVQYGNITMLLIPNATTATWNDSSITLTCSPVVGINYSFQMLDYYGNFVNITATVNNISEDNINLTVMTDQSTESYYLEVNGTLIFNRTVVLPRYYRNIPTMYVSYLYISDIERAGYSLSELAGENLLFEVTVENIYKQPQIES